MPSPTAQCVRYEQSRDDAGRQGMGCTHPAIGDRRDVWDRAGVEGVTIIIVVQIHHLHHVHHHHHHNHLIIGILGHILL